MVTQVDLGSEGLVVQNNGKAPAPEKNVLIVDPDHQFAFILRGALGTAYNLRHVSTIEDGLAALRENSTDVALLNWDWPDLEMADEVREQILREASTQIVSTPVLAFTWDKRRETHIQAIKSGAFDVFLQPMDVQELKVSLDGAYRRVLLERDLSAARALAPFSHVPGLIGNSKSMQRIYELTTKVSGVFTTVLVRGESGTGKELVARAIHHLSPRKGKAFMAFSPSALPETLIEDELFGHERGAFTGATGTRRGRFEEAQGGTVFLDEIGDLALPLQTKLLRVLQERTLERLGSSNPVPVDIRLICATNRDLETMVREGTFRQDLYFRISVFRIDLPPLRERRTDIPLLSEYFCRQFANIHKKNVRGLTPGFVSTLTSYAWPGNVRELQNVIERSLILADGAQLAVEDLPPELKPLAVSTDTPKGSFHEAVDTFRRELILAALRSHSGNRLRAAKELRISRSYLHRLLKKLDISDEAITASVPQESNA